MINRTLGLRSDSKTKTTVAELSILLPFACSTYKAYC